MKKIILFDTSIASPNKGDYIIMESCKKQLQHLLQGNYVLQVPTHTPISHWYQNFSKFNIGDYFKDVDYKFLCGTNLLNANMAFPTPLWNINIWNCKMAKGVVTVGVGMGSAKNAANRYTSHLLKHVLSSQYIHSTRDEKTADFLRGIGLKAINTGCATTWDLTNSFCRSIPGNKAHEVIFTLTDYAKDAELDKKMIHILLNNYRKVYFWIQGIGDLDYLHEIYSGNQIIPVGPTIEEYTQILQREIDFVGTRLHAGIKAMQMKKRSIIITVDNRAEDMKKSIDLCVLSRNEICNLEKMLYTDMEFKLNIKEENIRKWLEQFEHLRCENYEK